MASAITDDHEQSQAVTVGRGQDAIVVRARDHSRITLLRKGQELATEYSGGPEASFAAAPGAYEVRTDGTLEDVSTASLDVAAAAAGAAALRLSSDAPDRHAVDGVGELPADGSTSCTITIEKLDAAGDPVTGGGHNDKVFVRTTGGTLAGTRGTPIRSVRLRSGRATFRLLADDRPRLVTVQAFGERLPVAELPIEFVLL